MSESGDRRARVAERLRETVERLLEAGEAYASISIERLMSESDLSRSTFYAYFSDKSDLLQEWSREIAAATRTAGTTWTQMEGPFERDALRDALRRVMVAYRPHAALASAAYDATVYDERLRVDVTAVIDSHRDAVAEHVRRGQREGWVDATLLPDQTAAWLVWMTERVFHQHLARVAEDAEFDALVEGFADVVWNALHAPVVRLAAAS